MRQAIAQPALPRQIAQLLRTIRAAAHSQRIAIVKAQRHRHAQPHARQLALHLLQRQRLRMLENLQRDGAQVFGIDIDLPGLQRAEHDGGVAQPLQMLDARIRRGRLRQHLAQDVGLGKALGADVQHRRLGRRSAGGHAARRYRHYRQTAQATQQIRLPRVASTPSAPGSGFHSSPTDAPCFRACCSWPLRCGCPVAAPAHSHAAGCAHRPA